MERATIEVTGLVQGVGFRPFVYALATKLELRGFVQNRGAHVLVDVEGEAAALRAFLDRLTDTLPPTASVDRMAYRNVPPAGYRRFEIASSEPESDSQVRVPPDVATCDACVRELFDPGNRRYRHPFITCTTCGPRFSIVTALPYDRANTRLRFRTLCRQSGFTPVSIDMTESYPWYGMAFKALFVVFMGYERLVNSSDRFEGLRHTMDCVLQKSITAA